MCFRAVLDEKDVAVRFINCYRVRVTNANTYTKADSTRISPSFVNMDLARNDLREFYWTNSIMIFFFKCYFEEVVRFLKHAHLHLLFS